MATWSRTLLRLLILATVTAIFVALLSAFHLPIGILLLMIPGALLLLWMVIKFFRDNLRLARWVGWRRLTVGLLTTCLVFIPIIALLIPGYLLGKYVADQTNRGFRNLQAWSAPDLISEEIKKEIREKVEKEVKRNLPWYKDAIVWTGLVEDYEKIVETEVRIVTEKIHKAKPKPFHIRAIAGFTKTMLLFVSVYSTAWVFLLLLRSFSSLFGRIVVASDPPIHFDMRPHRYSNAKQLEHGFANSLQVGTGLKFSLEPRETLYVHRSNEPDNAVPSTAIRFSGGALLMRFRRNLVFMTKIRSVQNSAPIEFRCQGGNRFVSAMLADRQHVVISPSHLVGFSGTIRFSSHYDFNLAMLSMHRAASMVARGPGRLILAVQGEPGIHAKASQVPKVNMDKLLLFGMDTKFEIQAARGILDYYTSGCVVRPLKGNLFVSDPAPPVGRSLCATLWSLIKQIYMPI